MNKVPASGPLDASIMIVGEAPGPEEERMRRPFVGQSGKLLDECLHTAQLSRTQLYLTNVIKHRVPHNDINTHITFNSNSVTTSAAFNEYLDELREEIELVKPNVVVPMGNVALYALTGKTPITNWRGSILESTLVPGVKVVPTIHPAASFRQYLFTHQINHDLARAKQESSSPELNLPNPNMKLKPTLSEAIAYLDKCIATGICAVDIEVVSQEIECLAFATSDLDSCCIVLYDQSPVFTIEEEDALWLKIADVLEDPSIVKIFQNGVFDATFIYERYGIFTVNIEDTMIMQGLVTPDMPKTLAFIASIYTRYPYYKGEGKEWYKNPAGSPEGFWRYNCLDTLCTFGAYGPLRLDIERLKLTDTYRSHLAMIHPIMKMQSLGIRMDAGGMKNAALTAEKRIAELQQRLNEVAGMTLNANSLKQLKDYFYIRKGIKPYVKDGKPTTDEKAMIKLYTKGFEEAEIILEIRKLRKMKSTYLDVKLDGDRLKCSYNPIGTTTGRLSSSKNIFGFGTNMQNQPYEMKYYMYVDDGYVGYNADLSGADSRNVAYCGPVPIMRDAYDKGLDLHRLTASLIFHIPYNEVSDEPGSSDIGNGTFSQRYWGKKVNHSCNYGIGSNELSYRLEITVAEAKLLLNAYHETYPEVRSRYQAQIIEMLRNGRRVLNPMGRTRIFLDRWGETLFQDAYAFFSQSAVADVINRWGLPILDAASEAQLLNQVHDSLVFQIPLSVPFTRHAEILNNLRLSLEQSITWRAATYHIPVDIQMIRSHFADTQNLGRVITARDLEGAFAA